jgi:hypothetical protein
MTESEGRTFTWSPNLKPASEAQTDLQAQTAARQKLPRLPVYGPEVWPGTVVEFACKVQDDWEISDKTEAKTLNAALEQACQRYVQKNGKRFTAHSLRELLRKRKHKRAGDPL